MFTSILTGTGNLTIINALICTGASLGVGIIIAIAYMMQGNYTKNYVVSLAILPTLVQIVILMVNGNLGTSVAVLGAFSLVRFRSVPGSSKEIIGIFFAMAMGLATGMGFISFAAISTIIVSALLVLFYKTKFGEKSVITEKELKITIPENLDYTGVFDDIFEKYTNKVILQKVKTTNLGSMYELDYLISLKDIVSEKQMIDEIRCRNGNLTIICGRPQVHADEL